MSDQKERELDLSLRTKMYWGSTHGQKPTADYSGKSRISQTSGECQRQRWVTNLLLLSATKLRRLCFYRCLSVHWGGVVSQHAYNRSLGGGGVVSQHTLQVFRPTAKGKVEGIWPGGYMLPGGACSGLGGCLLWGVPAPRGCLLWGVSAPGEGGWWRPPHTIRRLLLQTVRILLECILVSPMLFAENCLKIGP